MKLSVLICTRNRAFAIVDCLDSIAAALSHLAPIDAEIVVVDNNSTDHTSARVRAWASTCAYPVNLQFEPRQGLSAARNCAMQAARGDLLVWTDDDCRMDKDHIAAALRHDAADTELVLRGGRVELGDPADLPLTIMTEPVPIRLNREMGLPNRDIGNIILGCNMTMRRALIDKLGLFDERFGPGASFPAGDETDYVFRSYIAGLTIEYVPDMIVFHHHGRKSSADGKKLLRNYMIATGGLYIKYLFKKPRPWRPYRREIKNAIREILQGKNYYMPEIGFSFKNLISYWLLGAVRYCPKFLRVST